jgi:choline dehydrogenase-like flavoprotein
MIDAGKFDYVIAGGGTAGCVLAARLSADPTVPVPAINPCISTMMVGEKCAQMIQADTRNHSPAVSPPGG